MCSHIKNKYPIKRKKHLVKKYATKINKTSYPNQDKIFLQQNILAINLPSAITVLVRAHTHKASKVKQS